jgi:hypothetical protein
MRDRLSSRRSSQRFGEQEFKLSTPMRPRQTDIEVRSSGNMVWKYVSPQKNWKYAFSIHCAQICSSEMPRACLRGRSPTVNRVGRPGRPFSAYGLPKAHRSAPS